MVETFIARRRHAHTPRYVYSVAPGNQSDVVCSRQVRVDDVEVSPPPLAPRRSLITALPSIPLIQPRSHGQVLRPRITYRSSIMFCSFGTLLGQPDICSVNGFTGVQTILFATRIGGSDHQPLFLGTITICLRNRRPLEFTSDYACSNSKDAKQAAAGAALRV